MTRNARPSTFPPVGPPDRGRRHAKMRAPLVPEHHVRRHRLFKLLDDVTVAPFTLVVAPAGAGKTHRCWPAGRPRARRRRRGCRSTRRTRTPASSGPASSRPSSTRARLGTARPAAGCGARCGLELVDALLEDAPRRSPARVRRDRRPASRRRRPWGPTRGTGPAPAVVAAHHRLDPPRAAHAARAAPGPQPARRGPLRRAAVLAGGVVRAPQPAGAVAPPERIEAAVPCRPTGGPPACSWRRWPNGRWAGRDGVTTRTRTTRRPRPGLRVARGPGDRRTPSVIEVLQATAITDRVNASLAHALTGRADAGAFLLRAKARGLFVTRIDADGWFEVHSLGADRARRGARERAPGPPGGAARPGGPLVRAGRRRARRPRPLAAGRPRPPGAAPPRRRARRPVRQRSRGDRRSAPSAPSRPTWPPRTSKP